MTAGQNAPPAPVVRARRRVSREGTPRRTRVPPVDYRDGLSPCLTCPSTRRRLTSRTSSNGALSTCAALVAIDRNSWSRSIGMGGRDHRNAQVATDLARAKAKPTCP